MLASQAARPGRGSVHDYPLDESPDGVRGLCGNVRDWCGNVWRRGGPAVQDGRVILDLATPDDEDFRVVRGAAGPAPRACAAPRAASPAAPGIA